ncbi:hypothetical protein DFH07DRAFT_277752 [Mycena maculata]|uniref:Protein CPL1-like domain-containing protein n=1 Tax=Mycena maculata TaxID=230809 RepID=A0AAD7MMF2_9AGAR|nr:hypothetical protein DFH07DRAFT_277752 [Mycena maculata]
MRFTLVSLTIVTLATLSRAAVLQGLVPRTNPSTVCACVSGSLTVAGVNCGTLETELCTCISVLTEVCTSSTRTPLTIGRQVGGVGPTVSALTDKINTCDSGSKKTCTHPDNSVPSCSRSNLCGYTCDDGYKDCNGSCQRSCPSSGTLVTKRDAEYWGHRVQKSCKVGWSACGISGGGPRDWECVDTRRDLESCGGCPTGTVSALTGDSTGADCTVIPNVADVSCVAGGCAVHKCLPGYKVDASGKACVEDTSVFRNTLHAAAAYGLEHIPFQK